MAAKESSEFLSGEFQRAVAPDNVTGPEIGEERDGNDLKRRKAKTACLYCRRSHMTCDKERPCSRCLKRGISYLCSDDPTTKSAAMASSIPAVSKTSPNFNSAISPTTNFPTSTLFQSPQNTMDTVTPMDGLPKPNIQIKDIDNIRKSDHQQHKQSQHDNGNGAESTSTYPSNNQGIIASSASVNQLPFFYSEHAGSEFHSLTEFLSMIDDNDMINSINLNNDPLLKSLEGASSITRLTSQQQLPYHEQNDLIPNTQNLQNLQQQIQSQKVDKLVTNPIAKAYVPNSNQPYVSDAARDKFFLTAADPTTEISPEERLKQVINAKLEAGLLKPYDYGNGYQRLQTYMDTHMAPSSRERILKPLSTFRPGFRAIAKTLKDIDLILVEENFERMLLDYDRVFTSMAIPACLWRRTGEIYRGNKEFASLVEVNIDDLKNGRLTIYELMTEESSVNFWEKYGAIAFDKTQKAVLSSCNLRSKDGRKKKNCCFSFTIRRDRYNIPSCIVGNFIPIQ